MTFSSRLADFWLAIERYRSGLKRSVTRVDGISIPYLHGGQGPTVLLIHGFGGDAYNFARVAARLRHHFHLVIPDLPGFGEAEKDPGQSYDIRSQARRIALFLDALATGPVHVGGNSMGGFIAARLAQLRPTQVRSLWLLDALGCASSRNSEMFELHRRTGRLPLIIRTREDFDECLRLVSARPFWLPASLRRRYAARAINLADLHSKIADLINQPDDDLTPLRDRMDVPTLIVWGEEDRILSPDCISEQCAVFTRNTVIRLPGIGHLPMVEAPDRVAADYLRFVSSLGSNDAVGARNASRSTNR